jgi:hypothetical protein
MCFEADWRNSRIANYVRSQGEEQTNSLKELLKQHYAGFRESYK